MAKKYGYNTYATHGWAIFEKGSDADPGPDVSNVSSPDSPGGIVGSSEWIWLNEKWARRIVAALNHFEGVSVEQIERLDARLKEMHESIVQEAEAPDG